MPRTPRSWSRCACRNSKRPERLYPDVTRAFRDVTPERYRLLEVLQRLGPVSIYALARELGRNYSNVHADISALLELELVARTPDGVYIPWEAVEWRLSTALPKAA